ncbi:MAG: IclR family transcriptional regulator [Dehalococcoidales bacterium]|nr:IclR family transcriptional regulator [Dehalococcoidales bacterium]
MPKRNVSSRLRKKRGDNGDNPPAVKSISRAVKILNCLGDGVNTLTDIAGICSLSKSTVHRLLKALEGSGLAIQNPRDHRYYLGPLITRLVTNPQTTHLTLVTCALGEMRRLSALLGETVNVCVMPALQNVIIHEISSTHDLKVTEENRRTGPQYAGAAVRVQLSQLIDQQLRIVMKHITIPGVTSNTGTNKETFIKLVKEARQLGYSVSIGEKIPGVIGVAAPIRHYTCPAALGIIGSEHRVRPRTNDIIREIQKSVQVISANVADVFMINTD